VVRNHESSPENLWPSRVVIDSSLAISRLTPEDAPEFYTAVDASRERLSRNLEWAEFFTPEKAVLDCQNMEEAMRHGSAAVYKIEYEGAFAGSVALIDRRHDEAELTIWLTEEAMGNHVATRSARALLELGFSNWNLAATVMHIEAGNNDSRNFASRVGARQILTATPASGNYETWEITRQEFSDAD
jgi:RimJ/RimL family protein N-acetyltransferase